MRRLALVLALLLAGAPALAQPAARSLYEQAMSAEKKGNTKEAVRLYERAARGGDHKAASRLAEIYDKGAPGVPPDYAESLRWHHATRTLGGGPRLIGDFPDPKRGY